jgi:hypothetical protein
LNLLVYQVGVVEEPFGCGGDVPGRLQGGRRPVEGPKDFLILVQLVQEPAGSVLGRDAVTPREECGMARKLLGAEQFCPQWCLAHLVRRAPSSNPKVVPV